ncbi:MAG: hypothetical protein Q8M53_10940 [Burkholderiales bacterium]|nr:hypothetical protein [Burkholderiales bacterium]
MVLEILNSAVALITGIFLVCMLQTTFKDSDLLFRLGVAAIAAGAIAIAIGPAWGISFVSFPQMLLNIALMLFVLQLRARQRGWTLQGLFNDLLNRIRISA